MCEGINILIEKSKLECIKWESRLCKKNSVEEFIKQMWFTESVFPILNM